jgi:hypothetical protein
MHNGSMPLILATAFPEEAALAQGGFFFFTTKHSLNHHFKNHNPCHCHPPRPNAPTDYPQFHWKRLHAVQAGNRARLKNPR